MAETTRATEVALMVLSGLISRQEQREHSTETLHQVEIKRFSEMHTYKRHGNFRKEKIESMFRNVL